MSRDISSIIARALSRAGIPTGIELVDVKWYGGMFGKDLTKEIDRRMGEVAKFVERTAKLSMKGPKTGIKYPWLKVRSSAPGEAPAAQIGQLRASITRKPIITGVWIVGTNVIYGRYLELGTSRMKPRPFLRPALDASAPYAKEIFRTK